MIAQNDRELLAAAVDGECTASERSAVKRLLRDSEEARALFARLKGDAHRLRNLPAVMAPPDLANSVLMVIAERAMTPTPLPPQRIRRFHWSSPAVGVGFAAAAVVLLAVSVLSYLYFAAGRDYNTRSPNQLASQNRGGDLEPLLNVLPNGEGAGPSRVARAERGPVPRDVSGALAKTAGSPELVAVRPREVEAAEPITSPQRPPLEIIQVSPANVRLPLILPVRDLDQPYPRQKLREEIVKDEIVRLDLFCKDSTRGAELLQAALKGRGLQPVVEAQAADRLKKKLRSDYLFYTESMTQEEMAQLLERLGLDDKQAEQKKPGEGQFDKFVLAPFVPADLERLARLLGVPASQLRAGPRKAAAVDIRRPFSDTTVAQLAQNLGKSGSTTAAAGSEKHALVLWNSLASSAHQSREVRLFLDRRGERKAGTTPLMLVLRQAGP